MCDRERRDRVTSQHISYLNRSGLWCVWCEAIERDRVTSAVHQLFLIRSAGLVCVCVCMARGERQGHISATSGYLNRLLCVLLCVVFACVCVCVCEQRERDERQGHSQLHQLLLIARGLCVACERERCERQGHISAISYLNRLCVCVCVCVCVCCACACERERERDRGHISAHQLS